MVGWPGAAQDRLPTGQTVSWKFSRPDLGDLLQRIDVHDKTEPRALAA
jgi:hypothetical protein